VPFLGHWYVIFALLFYGVLIVLAVWLVHWGFESPRNESALIMRSAS
jgi:hypothetical protein